MMGQWREGMREKTGMLGDVMSDTFREALSGEGGEGVENLSTLQRAACLAPTAPRGTGSGTGAACRACLQHCRI
jgi:hypothetical protein